MFKKTLMPLSITVVGCAVIALLVVAKPKPQSAEVVPPPSTIQVSVIPAKRESVRLAVSTQGTVYPKREIDLVAQVAGQIVDASAIYSEGGAFNKGQPLVQIDRRDYEVSLLNAQARMADAQRRLAEEQGMAQQAQREWRDLGNRQANDLFMRKPQLAAAKANLAFAEGDRAKAQLDLERTQVTAPFRGRIKTVYADVGQYVTPGTVVARVYDSQVYEIRVPLTEAQAALIDLPIAGHREQLPLGEVAVHGNVAGQPQTWTGQLMRADAFVDPKTRMYHAVVEIEGEQANNKLLPGLFVRVEISGRKLADVVKLPRSALFHGDQVIAVNENKRTKSHNVRVLRKTADHVWLTSDIADSVYIALEKQALLHDGTEVEPMVNVQESLLTDVQASDGEAK